MFFDDQRRGRRSSSIPGSCGYETDRSAAVDLFGELLGPYLCPRCIDAYMPVESPVCTCCGKVFATRHGEDHLCASCLRQKKIFHRSRSAGIYKGPLLTLIHQLKYHGRSELAGPLGELLYHTYCKHWKAGDIDWIVPVPLHPRKRRRRGFNQAHLMVARWPRYLQEEDNDNRVNLMTNILQRVRFTASQTGLERKQRQRNIKGAFKIKAGENLQKGSILLIDDVFTTGATVTECARVLLAGGAGRVDVLTLARAI